MMNQYAQATDCDIKAVELDPSNIEIQLSFRHLFQKLKKFEDALKCYEVALKQKPGDGQIHYLIGIAYGNKGDNEKALNSFEQALSLKPNFTDALIGKVVILAKLGRTNEAKLCAEKTLEIKKNRIRERKTSSI